MHRAAIALLFLTAMARAQLMLPAAESPRVAAEFEPRPGESVLRCEVTPLSPVLNFAFRFHVGYTFHVPRSQYSSAAGSWIVLTKIIPDGGEPVYLAAQTTLAGAAVAGPNFDIRGAYYLGTGRYSIESAIRDDSRRVCRQKWQVTVAPSRADRAVPLAMAPLTVRGAGRIGAPGMVHPDGGDPMSLTLMVNAATFSERRTVILDRERERIAQELTAILEHLPTKWVRVVVFSLEQQKEVRRIEPFQPRDLRKVVAAIGAVPQATVDVSVLQHPQGHVEFLSALIQGELNSARPARNGLQSFPAPTERTFGQDCAEWCNFLAMRRYRPI